MPNKRIRKKWSKRHGWCAKCGSHDTVSIQGWGKKGGRWRGTGFTVLQCFRCQPMTDKEQGDLRSSPMYTGPDLDEDE